MMLCTEAVSWQIAGGLQSVSVGQAGVWGINDTDKVWFRTRTYKQSGPGLEWVQVRGKWNGFKSKVSGMCQVQGTWNGFKSKVSGMGSSPRYVKWVQVQGK